MELVGAFVFPHGAITLDPDTRDFSNVPANLPTSKEECIKLHAGMKLAAETLIASKPDVIIMSTPHGLTLQRQYLFMGNNKAQGSAEWDGDWKDYKADINIDSDLTGRLVQSLHDDGSPVELLKLGAADDALNLRWGEVIPWWFINEAAIKAGVTVPKTIIFGQPRIRATGSEQLIPELLRLGANLSKFVKSGLQEPKRVAIVISSDLSHYHSKDPTSPYKYSENATVFDQYVTNWAKLDYESSGKNLVEMEENLLENAGDLADSIGSCGFTGLVFLHGFMKNYLKSVGDPNFIFKSHVYHYSAPTYYGMLTSSWI